MVFDCLDHELLTLPTLKLMQNYLSNRKQRTKINSSYSGFLEIIFGVAQGSILGTLLFNIFLVDLFFFVNIEIAYDKIPYVSGKDIEQMIQSLEEASKILLK